MSGGYGLTMPQLRTLMVEVFSQRLAPVSYRAKPARYRPHQASVSAPGDGARWRNRTPQLLRPPLAQQRRCPAAPVSSVMFPPQLAGEGDLSGFSPGEHMGPYMITASGRRAAIAVPEAACIAIADIAHHLARIARFCGATVVPYSVAQHSVLVARLLSPHGVRLMMLGLLHDAHEAYLGDLTSPVKWALAGKEFTSRYDGLAAAFDLCIWHAFGLRQPSPAETALVAYADAKALATEWRDLMPAQAAAPEGLPAPDPAPVRPLNWSRAEEAFLIKFNKLAPITLSRFP